MCHRLTVPNGGETKIETSISRLAVFIYTKRQEEVERQKWAMPSWTSTITSATV